MTALGPPLSYLTPKDGFPLLKACWAHTPLVLRVAGSLEVCTDLVYRAL